MISLWYLNETSHRSAIIRLCSSTLYICAQVRLTDLSMHVKERRACLSDVVKILAERFRGLTSKRASWREEPSNRFPLAVKDEAQHLQSCYNSFATCQPSSSFTPRPCAWQSKRIWVVLSRCGWSNYAMFSWSERHGSTSFRIGRVQAWGQGTAAWSLNHCYWSSWRWLTSSQHRSLKWRRASICRQYMTYASMASTSLHMTMLSFQAWSRAHFLVRHVMQDRENALSSRFSASLPTISTIFSKD